MEDIVFVGPPPEAMRAMGLKSSAKALMARAGAPVLPGYHGDNQTPKFLKERAYQIGYPVLIKAIAGGGGRGIRRVDAHIDFEAALESAQREARGGVRRCARADREADRSRRAISRCRCSATATATSCISTSATARCSAGGRS